MHPPIDYSGIFCFFLKLLKLSELNKLQYCKQKLASEVYWKILSVPIDTNLTFGYNIGRMDSIYELNV